MNLPKEKTGRDASPYTSGGQSRTGTAEHRRFRQAVLARADYTCQGCGHHDPTGRTLEADHIVPVSQGGATHPDNGQPLCAPCHGPKSRAEATAGRRKRPTRRAPEAHPGLT